MQTFRKGAMSLRRLLASPIYLIAIIFHLLTAFLSVLAQKVAGEDFETSHRTNVMAIIVIVCVGAAGLTFWAARVVDDPVQKVALTPQTPMPQWRGIPTGFSPEQVVWAKPLIRLTACIFAQRVVRQALHPADVGFDPCGEAGKVATTIDDDYFEGTVSGTVQVDSKNRTYHMIFNHYPPSTSEWGFIATDLQIQKEEKQVAAACFN